MKTAITYALLTVWTVAMLALIVTREGMPLTVGVTCGMIVIADYLVGCALIADRIAARSEEREKERDGED